MPNKPKAGTKLVGIRLPEELIARAKRAAELLQAETPGLELSYHDAIRITLTKYLPELEGMGPRGAAAGAKKGKATAKSGKALT
jgi:hypothetical protein